MTAQTDKAEILIYDVNDVNSAENRSLYKKREAIYPKRVKGKYRTIKWVLLCVTLGIYYGLPWLRWDRGPNSAEQAVLVDFPGQRFYFFSLEIWPNELYFVTGLMILAALSLFLVTSIWGRLWCGYSCPQTVWTDLFIAIERVVEGDRNKRLRLAKQPWNFDKISKKLIKHSLWLLVAACTGGAWIFYFHDAPTVAQTLFKGTAPTTAYIFLGLLTFTTYTLAGIMREQVCIYMCPWPRIQAAMTDAETFSVGYFNQRGEPRGKHKKNESWEGRGDCVDCKACVAACPMGIDIRKGDQLECINCGLCADACDEVMLKIDRPTGLIAYAADYRTQAKDKILSPWPNLFRSRTVFYSVAILIVSTFMAIGLMNRSFFEVNIERNRAPAFTLLSDGSLRNAITLSILNKQTEDTSINIHFSANSAVVFDAIGHEIQDNNLVLNIEAGKAQKVRVFMTLPHEEDKTPARHIDVNFTAAKTGIEFSKSFKMVGPS